MYNIATTRGTPRLTKDTRSVDQPTHTRQDLLALNDEALLALIARRHEPALATLYDRYIRLVYTVALRITGDRQTAEEVVQDVFQNVWQAAGSFQAGVGTPSAWLLGITRHRAIDAMRSKRERARSREQSIEQTGIEGEVSYVEDEVTRRLQRDAIKTAMQSLPVEQRQAIELAYYGGFTRNEIANELGQPVGTVKTRLRLGLMKLRDLLRTLEDFTHKDD